MEHLEQSLAPGSLPLALSTTAIHKVTITVLQSQRGPHSNSNSALSGSGNLSRGPEHMACSGGSVTRKDSLGTKYLKFRLYPEC